MVRWFSNLLARIALIAVLILFGLAAFVVYAGLQDTLTPADCLFVPARSLRPDGEPGAVLRQRLDRVVALYLDRKAPVVIVSGGDGADRRAQADAMARYLREHQVAANDVLEDAIGTDSAGAYRNAADLMNQHQLHSMILVTHYYNMMLTKVELVSANVTAIAQSHVGSPSGKDAADISLQMIGLFREMLARYVKSNLSLNLTQFKSDLRTARDEASPSPPVLPASAASSKLEISGVCSIVMPAGWNPGNREESYQVAISPPPDDPPSKIVLACLDRPGTMDHFVETFAVDAPVVLARIPGFGDFTDVEFAESKSFSTEDGTKGTRVIITARNEQADLQIDSYFFPGPGNRKIAVMGVGSADNALRDKGTFDRSARSLVIQR